MHTQLLLLSFVGWMLLFVVFRTTVAADACGDEMSVPSLLSAVLRVSFVSCLSVHTALMVSSESVTYNFRVLFDRRPHAW